MVSSTTLARHVIRQLMSLGVREVVVCPGSRNAPLSFALYEAAKVAQIHFHMRIDERSAGFFALGLSLASRRPVPVVVTSGTAVANLLPAVIEADLCGASLIVLSANRPEQLFNTGANQTINQRSFFTQYVQEQIVLTDELTLGHVDHHLSRAVSAAACGPVHIDIEFKEPLVPDCAAPQEFWHVPDQSVVSAEGETAASYPVDLSVDTVVIAGSFFGSNPMIPAELAHLPTVAEPSFYNPHVPLHPLALRLVEPQQVIVIGRPTLHREVSRLLGKAHVISLAAPEHWKGVPGQVNVYAENISLYNEPTAIWQEKLTRADKEVRAIVQRELDDSAYVTGLHIADVINRNAKGYSLLFVGSSNPVRDLTLSPHPLTIPAHSNRGAAGIDGNISTALGMAYAEGGRTLAVLGDITFLHDVGGLFLGSGEPHVPSLTIVIINDQGGGIFGLLEQGDPRFNAGDYAGAAERVFNTPHQVDFSQLCQGYGVAYARVTLAQLANELARSCQGLRVLEVVCDRVHLRELHQRIAVQLAEIN